MAYQDFLAAFAEAQGVESVDALLNEHSERYSFQIGSRDRARNLIDTLRRKLSLDYTGMRVLDIGCAYGSYCIELAKLGAVTTGVDVSHKWLRLAEVNARDEADAVFLNCDASSRAAKLQLASRGPFDLVILHDVFEHIYDTSGLLENVCDLLTDDGVIYYKVPNGHASRNVLSEGHKKVFALTQLPPDYWHLYVKAPFHVYYRRWPFYQALFTHFGLRHRLNLKPKTDPSHRQTRDHILADAEKIRSTLGETFFAKKAQRVHARKACELYLQELEDDVPTLGWDALYHKYRLTFWEGVLEREAQPREHDAPRGLRLPFMNGGRGSR